MAGEVAGGFGGSGFGVGLVRRLRVRVRVGLDKLLLLGWLSKTAEKGF